VDRFGNVQLSIPNGAAAELGIKLGGMLTIRCNRRELTAPYLETFGSAAPGELIAFTDSAGLISLAVTGGHAAEAVSLPPGAPGPDSRGTARLKAVFPPLASGRL